MHLYVMVVFIPFEEFFKNILVYSCTGTVVTKLIVVDWITLFSTDITYLLYNF